jgi:hypothetical protein
MRKRQTIASVLTISLLFGVMILALVVSGSFTKSLDAMSAELFKGKVYVVTTKVVSTNYGAETIKRAKYLYKSSGSTGRSPVMEQDSLGNATEPYLDATNEFAKQAIAEYVNAETSKTRGDIGNLAKKYSGAMVSMVDNYSVADKKIETDIFGGGQDTFGSRLVMVDVAVVGGLIRYKADSEAIPVLVSKNHAEQAIGLEPLSRGASAKDKESRLQQVYDNAPGTIIGGSVLGISGDELGDIKFQIVGVLPDGGDFSTNSAMVDLPSVILYSLSSASYYDTIVPSSYEGTLLDDHYQKSSATPAGGIDTIVEFGDLADAREYMANNNCKLQKNNCDDIYMDEFITRRVALSELTQTANTVIFYVIVFFAVLAVAIMTGMLARIISDERQTVAIYRAVGASKLMIRKIYVVYAATIALLTSLFALTVGYAWALILQLIYSGAFTVVAKELYGLSDSNGIVWLIGVDTRVILVILLIFVVSMGSVLLMISKTSIGSVSQDIKAD